MNNFSWTKSLGFGFLIWLIMFILATITVSSGLELGIGAVIGLAVVAGLVSYGFAFNTSPDNVTQAISYGVIFTLLGILLDLLVSRQLQPQIFGLWSYWLGYVLVLFAPLLAVKSHQEIPHSHA